MQTHQLLVEVLIIESHRRYQMVDLVLLLLYFLGARHVQNAAVHHLVVEGSLLCAQRHCTVESITPLLGHRGIRCEQSLIWNLEDTCQILVIVVELILV